MVATTIKQYAWVLAAMVVLSAALAVLSPGIAEAQSPEDTVLVSTLPELRRGLIVLPGPKTPHLLRLLARRWYINRSRLAAVGNVSGGSTRERSTRGAHLLTGE